MRNLTAGFTPNRRDFFTHRIVSWYNDWSGGLPNGVLPADVWGFNNDGKPRQWPMRFRIAHWTVTLKSLPSGKYELRIRTVDANGYAQPEPRPSPRSGQNPVRCKLFEVA